MNPNSNLSANSDASGEFWTKEAKRIEQITKCEDKINYYKEIGEWGLVLNTLEDYLRYQVEAIEEKDEKGKKVYGIDTPTYKEQSKEIYELELLWRQVQGNRSDLAFKLNARYQQRELIMRIRRMIDRIYHNNIRFNLTYRKKFDPTESWKH